MTPEARADNSATFEGGTCDAKMIKTTSETVLAPILENNPYPMLPGWLA
jgi:hypothetical protein